MFQRIRRLFGGAGKSPTSTQPGTFFGAISPRSASGMSVSVDSSLNATAVFAAVKVLSEDVAKLPIMLKQKRSDGGTEVVENNPVARVLRQPNDWQTSFEFRQMLQQDLALRGNAFAAILRNGRGEVRALIPVRAGLVTINTTHSGELFYQLGLEDTFHAAKLADQPVMVPQEDMLHLRWMARDGVTGTSPIACAREAVGLSLAAEKHGAASFGNDATPGGVLEHPQNLSDEAASRLRKQRQEKFQGPANASAPAVLEEGMQFKPFELNNEDRQFLETRKFQVEEISRIFRVPPHMISQLDNATFSNIESQSLDYVKNTLMAWLELWESALDRDLLRNDEQDRGLHVKFDTNRILRGTIDQRFQAHQIALQTGIKSFNEVRLEEGLNPVQGGDQIMRPLNMGFVGSASPDSPDVASESQVDSGNAQSE